MSKQLPLPLPSPPPKTSSTLKSGSSLESTSVLTHSPATHVRPSPQLLTTLPSSAVSTWSRHSHSTGTVRRATRCSGTVVNISRTMRASLPRLAVTRIVAGSLGSLPTTRPSVAGRVRSPLPTLYSLSNCVLPKDNTCTRTRSKSLGGCRSVVTASISCPRVSTLPLAQPHAESNAIVQKRRAQPKVRILPRPTFR